MNPEAETVRDAELLEAVGGGDERAFAELHRRYAAVVFSFVLARTADRGAAEEVSADTGGATDLVGCGALHVMWDDIAEVRTLAVRKDYLHRGVGSAILTELLERARALGLRRVFCLTFEVDFFAAHGFHPIWGTPVGMDTFAEMGRSHDDGVAEFLDLARVKPNTLGNARMLLHL